MMAAPHASPASVAWLGTFMMGGGMEGLGDGNVCPEGTIGETGYG